MIYTYIYIYMNIPDIVKKNKLIIGLVLTILIIILVNKCNNTEHMDNISSDHPNNNNQEDLDEDDYENNLDEGDYDEDTGPQIDINNLDTNENNSELKNNNVQQIVPEVQQDQKEDKLENKSDKYKKFIQGKINKLKSELHTDDIWNTNTNATEEHTASLSQINNDNLNMFKQINAFKTDNDEKLLDKLNIDEASKSGYLVAKYKDTDTNETIELFLTRLSLSDCGMTTDENLGNNDCTNDVPILLTRQVLLELENRDNISTFRFIKKDGGKTRFFLMSKGKNSNALITQYNHLMHSHINILCFRPNVSQCKRDTTLSHHEKKYKLNACKTQHDVELEFTSFGFRMKFMRQEFDQKTKLQTGVKTFYASACKTNNAPCISNNEKQFRLCLTTDITKALTFKFVNYRKDTFSTCMNKCSGIFTKGNNIYRETIIDKMIPVMGKHLLTNEEIVNTFTKMPDIEKLKHLNKIKNTIKRLEEDQEKKSVPVTKNVNTETGKRTVTLTN